MEAIKGSVKGVFSDLTSLNFRQLLNQIVTLGESLSLPASHDLCPASAEDCVLVQG